MWFRNLQIYRLGDDWKWDAARLSEKLAQAGFQACGAFDMQSRCWVPPRGEEGELLVAVNRQWLIALGVEQKLLPAAVIRQYTQARVAELEAKQGFKAGRAQERDLREQVTAELLPRAFVKRRLVYVWIDPINHWLVVDAASPTKAEEVLEHLKGTLDDLPPNVDVLPVRVTVKTIGSLPVSAPVASVTATDTVGSTGAGPMIVTLCVAVVVLPKTSVAVHVIVVTPTANRLPVGTPVRVTATPISSSP